MLIAKMNIKNIYSNLIGIVYCRQMYFYIYVPSLMQFYRDTLNFLNV